MPKLSAEIMIASKNRVIFNDVLSRFLSVLSSGSLLKNFVKQAH
jgi:hypothetical protein